MPGFGPIALAGPKIKRARVAAQAPRPRERDPLVEEFGRASLAFLERIRVGNARIADFAARQCAFGRTSLLAEELAINTLEDIVIVLVLPALGAKLKDGRGPGCAVHLLPSQAETELVSGPAFRL
jgi:hypothetical protein